MRTAVTNPHQNNKNVVESKFSNEAFATTTGPKIDLSHTGNSFFDANYLVLVSFADRAL